MECCICLENGLNISMVRFPCSHKICLQCLCEIIKTECPMCRVDITKDIPKRILNIIDENRKDDKKSENGYNLDIGSDYQFPPL